ncbi:MAG: hypothetical protein OEZ00_01700 [Dehalococcoidia bacterium]|nr:hypothetical protein [Dehalococcoidia bacterium]
MFEELLMGNERIIYATDNVSGPGPFVDFLQYSLIITNKRVLRTIPRGSRVIFERLRPPIILFDELDDIESVSAKYGAYVECLLKNGDKVLIFVKENGEKVNEIYRILTEAIESPSLAIAETLDADEVLKYKCEYPILNVKPFLWQTRLFPTRLCVTNKHLLLYQLCQGERLVKGLELLSPARGGNYAIESPQLNIIKECVANVQVRFIKRFWRQSYLELTLGSKIYQCFPRLKYIEAIFKRVRSALGRKE